MVGGRGQCPSKGTGKQHQEGRRLRGGKKFAEIPEVFQYPLGVLFPFAKINK